MIIISVAVFLGIIKHEHLGPIVPKWIDR